MHRLIAVELKRSLLMLRRYPLEMIGQLIVVTMIFYGLFLGARYIAGPAAQFGQRLDALVVGYVLWAFSLFAIGDLSWGLMDEARTGTLEQVFLSPFGPARVYMARNVAGLLVTVALNAGILALIMLITGARLEFSTAALTPLVTVLLGAYGLCFLLGALALFFKRIQAFLNLFQFVLMFLIMTPFERLQTPSRIAGYLMPMTPGAGQLRSILARGEAFDTTTFALGLANGLVYLLLGLWVFGLAVRAAKARGLLGGY
ncbi:ABC transporter permease [Oceanithermus sp.]